MLNIIKLAFRNVFRNKKRSLISGIAIIFGLIILINADFYVEGLYNGMNDTVIKSVTGHIEIHAKGYVRFMEDKTSSTNNLFNEDDAVNLINDTLNNDIKSISNHIVYTTLIRDDSNSCQGFIKGIYPDKEKDLYNNITIKKGTKLTKSDKNKIIVNKRIQRVFNLKIGDKITLLAGDNKPMKFEIKGVFDTDVQFGSLSSLSEIYLNMDDASKLINTNNKVSEINIVLKDNNNLNKDMKLLKKAIINNNLDLEVHSYKYLGRNLLDIASYIKIGIRAWTVIIFIVILFMILNTFIMSVYERTYEIGILKAIGMKRRRIMALFIFEGGFLSILANTVGVIISLIIVKLLNIIGLPGMFGFILKGQKVHPSPNISDILLIIMVSVIISILASLYPAKKASKMNPIDAILSE